MVEPYIGIYHVALQLLSQGLDCNSAIPSNKNRSLYLESFIVLLFTLTLPRERGSPVIFPGQGVSLSAIGWLLGDNSPKGASPSSRPICESQEYYYWDLGSIYIGAINTIGISHSR